MTRLHTGNERGFVLIYMGLILTVLMLFSGLALDAGRAYLVKAALSKAVDGAVADADVARHVVLDDLRRTHMLPELCLVRQAGPLRPGRLQCTPRFDRVPFVFSNDGKEIAVARRRSRSPRRGRRPDGSSQPTRTA